MTDGEVVKLMRRIGRLSDQLLELVEHGIMDHQNSEALREDLHENGLGYGFDCALIVHSHLRFPERWEYDADKRALRYIGVIDK